MKEPKNDGGPLRFGFGWLTNFHPEESIAIHHTALLDLIAHLTLKGIADPARVFLLGFSQSCALNYRFAFTHGEKLRGVIGICGGIPGDWETNKNYQTANVALFHLSGERDQIYPPDRIKDYAKQLGTRAGSVTSKSYDAEHEIVPSMRTDIREWLLERAATI